MLEKCCWESGLYDNPAIECDHDWLVENYKILASVADSEEAKRYTACIGLESNASACCASR